MKTHILVEKVINKRIKAAVCINYEIPGNREKIEVIIEDVENDCSERYPVSKSDFKDQDTLSNIIQICLNEFSLREQEQNQRIELLSKCGFVPYKHKPYKEESYESTDSV